MDFTLDDVQRELRDLARKILDERITTERLKELEAAGAPYDERCWADLAATNLLGVALPEDVGGSGYGLMELCVLLEEVGRHVAPVPLLATVGAAALPIAELGSAELRARLLPPVVEGRSLLTAALQEPGHADPLAPTTLAKRDGNGWRLEGEKLGVPYAPLADAILVPASTGDGDTGEARAAVFVVTPDADGLTIESATATNGEPQGHVTMTGVRVEDADVLGDPSAPGAETVAWVQERALAGLCATAVGVFEKALRITAGYISERKQFDRPIATFQGATLRAADAYIDTEAIRVTAWSAIWRLAAGRDASDDLAIAKFWVADGGQRVAHACQHLHGGIGATIDYPIHRYFTWAKALEHSLGGAPEHLLRLGDSLAAGRI
ncbi:MAG TPA: acyl-CoA dehydrogenase family protein [Acidimicrobiia bacterium]